MLRGHQALNDARLKITLFLSMHVITLSSSSDEVTQS